MLIEIKHLKCHCPTINCFTGILLFIFLFLSKSTCCREKVEYIFSCKEDNDLYVTVKSNGLAALRYNTPADAIENAPAGSAVLILADQYPEDPVEINNSLFEKAAVKKLKLYIEFPASLPGLGKGEIKQSKWERQVVTSDVFGNTLPQMSILLFHDCHFTNYKIKDPFIVTAKVAGFDKAVFGISNTESYPTLFSLPGQNILVSSTKLSNFITGRYAPRKMLQQVWSFIFTWLNPSAVNSILKWDDSVYPSHSPDETLTKKDYLQSIDKGADWFYNSKLLVNKDWIKRIYKNGIYDSSYKFIPDSIESGDGSLGIHECFGSVIKADGTQPVFWDRRADCCSEASMALAMHSYFSGDAKDKETAAHLQSFIYNNSNLQKGVRALQNNANYGFIGWNDKKSGEGIYYGDDNARAILGTLLTSAALNNSEWDEAALKAILANFRSCNKNGFKPRRLEENMLDSLGWQYYSNDSAYVHTAPHFQSWLWAVYLWLYDKTGYTPLLEKSRNGIIKIMEAYPDKWHWTNGLQQERARMILPLAWLLRVENTETNRNMLYTIINDLLEYQDSTGGIRENLGSAGLGTYTPPASNKEYGTREAPLIQENGDAAADMLYTCNFAFAGLIEASAVTKDEKIKEAVNKLAGFLVRIQAASQKHKELDGVWFRAFDLKEWQYRASNADNGWGAWATETGWTQGWITASLIMQQINTNMWDFTKSSDISRHFNYYKNIMLNNNR
jgi:hypothetical protein